MMPGFKHTDVGSIPLDWEVFRLSDNFNIYAGGDVPKHAFLNIVLKLTLTQSLLTHFIKRDYTVSLTFGVQNQTL